MYLDYHLLDVLDVSKVGHKLWSESDFIKLDQCDGYSDNFDYLTIYQCRNLL